MTIDEQLDYSDSGKYGQWLGYSVYAEGNTLQELFDDATIYITDQDGGEVNNYSLFDAPNEAIKESLSLIRKKYKEKNDITIK